ncbi:MAG: hypothetical protein ABR575_04130 [Actinomycetota bacterium]
MTARRSALVALSTTVILLAPPAAAQTPSSADLSLTPRDVPATPLVGDVFQISFSIANSGPDAAPDAAFSDYVSPELEVQAVSSSDPADVCGNDEAMAQAYPKSGTEGSDGGDTGPGSRGGGGVSCTFGTLDTGETRTVTLTLKRVSGRAAYNSAWVGSSAEDPNYDDNYFELYLEPDTSNPVDVGVTMTGPPSPEVGAAFSYSATVSNAGPSAATGATFVSPVPYGLDVTSFESGRAGDICRIEEHPEGGYGEVVCDLATIPAGSSLKISFTAVRTTAWEIWADAWVQASNYDDNYDNDYGSYSIAADPSVTSDLDLDLRGPAETPVVGDTFDLTLTVTNRGPSAVGDVWLSDSLPPELDLVSVTPAESCSSDGGGQPVDGGGAPSSPDGVSYYPVYGNGVHCSLGSLAVDRSAVVTLTVTRTGARELWNSAWVSSSNYEPNYDNNYADLWIGPDKSRPADTALVMTAPATPEVGTDFDFTLDVSNLGPSQADDVTVIDHLPYGTDFVAVATSDPAAVCTFSGDGPQPLAPESDRPSFYGDRSVSCEMGSMASGATTRITITVTRTTDYEIWNSAWARTSNYDPDFENDEDSVLVEGRPYEGDCPAAGGTETGTGGADSVAVGRCDVESKAGADSIQVVSGSSSGSSTIAAGRGDDSIAVEVTAAAADGRVVEVNGGRGADTITLSVAPGAGGGTIRLHGGRGDDHIAIDVPDGVDITVIATGDGGRDQVLASGDGSSAPASDLRLRGGEQADVLQGGDGHDALRGGMGWDRLFGGFGKDVLLGGAGADVCHGGPGRDTRRSC